MPEHGDDAVAGRMSRGPARHARTRERRGVLQQRSPQPPVKVAQGLSYPAERAGWRRKSDKKSTHRADVTLRQNVSEMDKVAWEQIFKRVIPFGPPWS